MEHWPQFLENILLLRVGWLRITEQFAEGLPLTARMSKSNSDSDGLWRDRPELAVLPLGFINQPTFSVTKGLNLNLFHELEKTSSFAVSHAVKV